MVPVKVVSYPVLKYLKTLSADARLRLNEKNDPFDADQDNFIFDFKFLHIIQSERLAKKFKEKAGIIKPGLFLGLATDVIVVEANDVQHLVAERKRQGA